MRRKLFKKMTAVVLTAAMVLTAGVWQAPKCRGRHLFIRGVEQSISA